MDTTSIPCLSLWQPWASLVAIGAKQVETRHWKTNYRGPIAIHAAKRTNEILDCADRPFFHVLKNAGLNLLPSEFEPDTTSFQTRQKLYGLSTRELLEFFPLPFGAIVAVAELTDCRGTEAFRRQISANELAFGDFSDSRFGWVLENVRALEAPILYRGQQGLFRVDMPSELLK